MTEEVSHGELEHSRLWCLTMFADKRLAALAARIIRRSPKVLAALREFERVPARESGDPNGPHLALYVDGDKRENAGALPLLPAVLRVGDPEQN